MNISLCLSFKRFFTRENNVENYTERPHVARLVQLLVEEARHSRGVLTIYTLVTSRLQIQLIFQEFGRLVVELRVLNKILPLVVIFNWETEIYELEALIFFIKVDVCGIKISEKDLILVAATENF